ncbi:putative tRNA methyltransferase [Aspergillus lucknowensis]|uniref:Transfer RNA methyltransferase 82 n=1 Tax=Aspergillus lucknowensis TaxID=176173 RepID=A0ABR4LHJ3_9EURO
MAENFQHPFQGIQFVKRKNGASKDVLVASAGANLYSYAVESGQRLSVWPQDGADIATVNDTGSKLEHEGPPEKKRKVDSSENATKTAPAKKAAIWSHIPILASTPDGEYVVALTGEDKCIRVFQIEEDGSFQQLSARPMPKRPCSITFMDENDILIGDKFGDVYSMPLIPSATPRAVPRAPGQIKPRQPAATNLTVHTQRNLKSLEMQQQQLADKVNKAKDEDKPTFEHQLLLGHVSLLTDVAFVSLPSPDPSSARKRGYILSADRDEHIRVSRGPPQAHVIENYCLGHSSFISKLCVPQWAPEYLISGGGDPHLLVWNWVASQILQKVPLVAPTPEPKDVAVRGIWASSLSLDNSHPIHLVLVALEGNPTLQSFTLGPDGALTPHNTIKTTSNILDVQIRPEINTVLISVDCIREPGSTEDWQSAPASSSTLLEAYCLKQGNGTLEWEPVTDALINSVNAAGTSNVASDAEQKAKTALNNSLYGLENLRKAFREEDAGSVL